MSAMPGGWLPRRLIVLPALLALAAAAVAGAPVASADCSGTITCDTSAHSDPSGHIAASAQAITITVHGGRYASTSAQVPIPASVMPPCYYTPFGSGADVAQKAQDPKYTQLAHHVGEDPSTWWPPDYQQHATDDGNYYSWECNSAYFNGSVHEFFAFVDQWSAGQPDWVWVAAGDPPPVPPVPPAILAAVARQYLDDAVRMPIVRFNPATRTFVNLDTWMWFDPAAWQPISVTAAAGGNSVTVTATPSTASVGGLPAGSTSDTGCTGGGKPWSAGLSTTDCSVTFGRSSGGQPGQAWSFTVSLSWTVTAVGAPLTGPPVITLTANPSLQVLEAQTTVN
jgi:hypothetical protein